MDDSEIGSPPRCGSVSGSKRCATKIAIAAAAPMTMKLARQPNAVCSTPPIIGATIGAKALIEPISDSSRAARTPEYRSRTMARASTIEPAPPTACRNRAAIRVSMDCVAAQISVPVT